MAEAELYKLKDGMRGRERRALAHAITLLESTRWSHRDQAESLLTALLPDVGKSFRIGITGVPGVGKSTFIEMRGLKAIEAGQRVAVLTVDPTSVVSGGSILGDKTRMEKLGKQSGKVRESLEQVAVQILDVGVPQECKKNGGYYQMKINIKPLKNFGKKYETQ